MCVAIVEDARVLPAAFVLLVCTILADDGMARFRIIKKRSYITIAAVVDAYEMGALKTLALSHGCKSFAERDRALFAALYMAGFTLRVAVAVVALLDDDGACKGGSESVTTAAQDKRL